MCLSGESLLIRATRVCLVVGWLKSIRCRLKYASRVQCLHETSKDTGERNDITTENQGIEQEKKKTLSFFQLLLNGILIVLLVGCGGYTLLPAPLRAFDQ